VMGMETAVFRFMGREKRPFLYLHFSIMMTQLSNQ
jgi:hypothetical protein